ncbi:MAG: 16S rRNA (cytidine(1402)-2'-O)-methyltransferase [Candidatus Krumholzibacteriaceae bacterium]|jgi:16S rRNA (cytidine1402-2'-O)-methyltransferase
MKLYPFYLVSTPIGNLGDLSGRAAETLRSVDCVLAEDTRTVRVLLDRYGIRVPLRSYHDHNKEAVAPDVIREIGEGKRFALVSDAGTPLISDPGYYLVRKLIEGGVAFTAIPGASAVTTALVLSGLPPDRFTFYGYVPRKTGERGKAISEAAASPYTSIFYESPHRLRKTLEAASEILGDREVVVARELTKMHEEVLRGTAAELAAHFSTTAPRGEITLLVRGLGKRRSGV